MQILIPPFDFTYSDTNLLKQNISTLHFIERRIIGRWSELPGATMIVLLITYVANISPIIIVRTGGQDNSLSYLLYIVFGE